MKKVAYFFETTGKWMIIQGDKKIIVQHPAHFRRFLKATAEKLMPQPKVNLKFF